MKTGAYEKLLERCRETAVSMYGNTLPKEVNERLNMEMDVIVKNGWADNYLIAICLSDKSHSMGYQVSLRGTAGASFVSFLCGISSVNPLLPHYACPQCHHFEMSEGSGDFRVTGLDLPAKACPHCGTMMRREGSNIGPEIVMGINMIREPEFALNVAPRIRKELVHELKTQYSEYYLLRAGISRKDENRCIRLGAHPGGVYIVPQDMDISTITPLRECDRDDEFQLPITVRDYNDLHGILKKIDILTLPELDMLHDLEEKTGYRQVDINLSDKKIIEFVCQEGVNTLLGNAELIGEMKKAIQCSLPKCFSDIARLLGLLHGVGTWRNNAERMIEEGIALHDLICFRDDVYQYLMNRGIEKSYAWNIMRSVMFGKGISTDNVKTMLEAGASEWYIESCRKIRYLYPKSQMVEYAAMLCRLAYYRMCFPSTFEDVYRQYEALFP